MLVTSLPMTIQKISVNAPVRRLAASYSFYEGPMRSRTKSGGYRGSYPVGSQLAMYGLVGAVFDQREGDEHDIYETIEANWLGAWWDLYAQKVEQGEVFEITQQGISTGLLLMSEERFDGRQIRREITWDMSDEIAEAINEDIIGKIVSAAVKEQTLTAIPADLIVPEGEQMTEHGLRCHAKILERFPSTSSSARTLQAFGVLC